MFYVNKYILCSKVTICLLADLLIADVHVTRRLAFFWQVKAKNKTLRTQLLAFYVCKVTEGFRSLRTSLPGQSVHVLGDYLQHHLVGARADGHQPSVPAGRARVQATGFVACPLVAMGTWPTHL